MKKLTTLIAVMLYVAFAFAQNNKVFVGSVYKVDVKSTRLDQKIWVKVTGEKTCVLTSELSFVYAVNSITVPPTVKINGKYYTVVGMEPGAFNGNHTTLENITLPATITSVPAGAFANVPKLRQITFEAKELTLATGFIRNCPNLKFVYARHAKRLSVNEAALKSLKVKLYKNSSAGASSSQAVGLILPL